MNNKENANANEIYTKMYYHYETNVGKLTIIQLKDKITNISIYRNNIDGVEIETPLLQEAYKQINEYLTGNRQQFQLPLSLAGSEHCQLVWKELQNIRYGETISYKELSSRISWGNPRVVGTMNGKNPLLIVIPCHRVIGSDNSLKGYAGGLAMKQRLLELEKRFKIAK